MNNTDKVQFGFEVDFTKCDASDTMKEMVVATIKHDITNVLENHVDMVKGFTYSDIEAVEIGKHKFNCLDVVVYNE